MAIGDICNGLASVAASEYLSLQPSAGTEWVIHNISFGGAIEIYYYDGTNEIKCDAEADYGGRFGYVYHCNNAKYYRIKNVTAGAIANMISK